MNKVFYCLIFSFLILLNTSAFSQEFYGGDVRFGLAASPNLSWFNPGNDHYESDGSRLGWSWGLNMDYFLTPNYAFSTGLKMLNYGGIVKYPDLYQNNLNVFRVEGISNVRYSAIQIPLALKMRTSFFSAFNVYGKFGFNTAFNYSRTEDYEISSGINFEDDDRDYNDESRFFNLGILVGGGVEFNISGTTSAVAGITYHQGILNQVKGKAYITDDAGVIDASELNEPKNPSGDDKKATVNFISLDLGIFF